MSTRRRRFGMPGMLGFFVDDKDRQCTGKRSFGSKAEGKKAIRRSRGKKLSGRDNVRVYLCPWCGKYHIGSKAGKNPKHKQDQADGA